MTRQPDQPQPDRKVALQYATPGPRRQALIRFGRQCLNRAKPVAKWSARCLLVLVIVFSIGMGFGTPPSDAEKLRQFADAVDRWQHNPEFRKVQVEYVEMGSDAMRTRTFFVQTTKGIMWLRSLPGLPPHLRVNDTSFAHYTNFTRGPLSAYMHLTGEQGLADTLKMIKELGNKQNLNDEDIRNFLRGYKLHYPVVSDDGAVASVKSLINDVDAGRNFEIQDNVAGRIKPHIAAVATDLGYSPDVTQMTPAAQLEVWRRLDHQVKDTDYELWRTKQVNDWLNGVWAQVYGTMYSGLINPTLLIREIGRVAGPALLMAWIALAVWKRRTAMGLQAAVAPTLALNTPKELADS